MTRRSRSSFTKRQKEMARQQKQRDKQARRLEAKERPASAPRQGDEDPDIAGIRPGPQPLPDFWDDLPPVEPSNEQEDGER